MPGVPEPLVRDMEAFSARVTQITHLTSSAPGLLDALRRFDRFDAISLVAGLLLTPECRPAMPRIEALLHAVVIGCAGNRKPGRREVASWFNRHVDRSELGRSEDPPEGLMAMHVWCDAGNFQFCGGIWEHPDYIVQTVLDLIRTFPDRPEFQVVEQTVIALLRITTDAIKRCELSTIETGAEGYVTQVPLPDADTMAAHASFLRFSPADMKALNVDSALLGAFVLSPAHYGDLAQENFRFSSLNRFPLLERNGEFLLALPTGVCFAIREFFVEAISRMGLASQMGDQLRLRQLHGLGYDCLSPLGGVQVTPEGRPPLNLNLPVDDFIVRFDAGSYCIAWFARDERFRAGRAADSQRSWDKLAPEMERKLAELIEFVGRLPDFRRGLVLVVYGAFSGGIRMGLPKLSAGWYLQSYALPNLEIIARTSGADLARLWRIARAEAALRAQGVTIINLNGDFNLYAWWLANRHRLLPSNANWNGRLTFQIPLNGLLELRVADRRAHGRHMAFRRGIAQGILVRRKVPDALFDNDRDRPFFVEERGPRERRLWAVIESSVRSWWIICDQWSEDAEARSVILQIWKCACEWTFRLAPLLEAELGPFIGPIEFQLQFVEVERWHQYKDEPLQVEAVKAPSITLDRNRAAVLLVLDRDFFAGFRQPANRAERLLTRTLVEAAFDIVGQTMPSDLWPRLDAAVFPSDQARFFHSHLTNDLEFAGVAVNGPTLPLLQDEVVVEARSGSAEPTQQIKTVTDRNEAKQVTFAAVDRLKRLNLAQLGTLDRDEVVLRCFRSIESVRTDRHQWRLTAASLRAFHPLEELERVAGDRESRRAAQAMATRTLLEAAMFACPDSGGAPIAELEFDDLLARQLVLIELGTFAEELKSPLDVDPLRILPSGEIECGGVVSDHILRDYSKALFRTRLAWAAETYADFFSTNKAQGNEELLTQISTGLLAEYGLDLYDIADGTRFLAREAERRHQSCWLTTESELAAFLAGVLERRATVVQQFLRRIRLYPWRLADGDAPAGFKVRDTAPWHFRRRFALLARPLVALDNQADPRVVICPAQWHESFDHLARQIVFGSFNQEFFNTADMRAVVRDIDQRRGTEFEQKVGDLLSASGFVVRMNLAMPTLGAPQQLGEIDVLAWKPSGEVWIIECKLLRAAYSMADVVHQLKEFGGNPGDYLGQHLARVEWLNVNRPALTQLSADIPVHSIRALLVTSNLVPLQFLTDNRFRGTQVVNYGAVGTVVPGLPVDEEE